MKEFYVYGFKTREQYSGKSARSYDNEKRRIESYLGDYMGFHQTSFGKNVFISIDSRKARRNPLYKALKAKSFTDGDITLHFILLDILYSPEISKSLNEITDIIDCDYLSGFNEPMLFDRSTVRKKLKEYTEIGIIKTQKQGKQILYSRAEDVDLSRWESAVEFFSEAGLCGAVGSFLLDKTENTSNCFSFKHHYITHALESETLCRLFEAIRSKACVTVVYERPKKNADKAIELVPLKIFISVQSGRRYLLGYNNQTGFINSYRIDNLSNVKIQGRYENFEELKERLADIEKNMWGVSLNEKKQLEHVEFTIHIGENEEYIYRRLLREKRTGTVERIDRHTCRFSADVYDSNELIPWIRTFICRIVSVDFSNKAVQNTFKNDIEAMYRLYGIGGD